MKLTRLLFGKYDCIKGIPGNIWNGKHRFVPPVTHKDRAEMWKRLMYEEETMMYLKNPYVSKDEEQLYLEKHATPQEKILVPESTNLKPLEQRTVAYHLGRLNHTRIWGDDEYDE